MTQTVVCEGPLLHELIMRRAQEHPEAIAMIDDSSSITYAELKRKSESVASEFLRSGINVDDVIGIYMERSIDCLIAIVGVLLAGGAYLPLDPSAPIAHVKARVDAARPLGIVTHDGLRSPAFELCLPVWTIDDIMRAPKRDLSTSRRKQAQLNLAYVIYTSGSTGRPKGVAITHGGIVNRLMWMQKAYGLKEGERVLHKTPLGFDVSVWEIFWPLLQGAVVVIARPGGHQDPDYIGSLIAKHSVTTIHFVPPMLDVFLRVVDLGLCFSVRRIICSGQLLPLELQRRVYTLLPEVSLFNLYGPTEASVDVTHWTCDHVESREFVPIGGPIENMETYVLDEKLSLTRSGQVGELYLSGIGLARCYLNEPGLTADRFVANPFGPCGQRMYRTGDLVRVHSPEMLEFVGRVDDQVKVNGVRIELGEIEAKCRLIPGIANAAATTERESQGNERLVVYVTLSAGLDSTPTPYSIRQSLASVMPRYMTPSRVVIVDRLPLTSTGKVDRKALGRPDGG